jgi:hypothetical protein
MGIFEHFWIDLFSASEGKVGSILAERAEDKDAKNDKKICIKNFGIGSSTLIFLLKLQSSFHQSSQRLDVEQVDHCTQGCA